MRVTVKFPGETTVVEVGEERIYALEPGLGGFEQLRRYALLPEEDSPVEWLQSVDEPEVAFALLEPFLFYADYAFELADRDVQELGVEHPSDLLVRSVLTLHERPDEITANLRAPIVLCRRTHLARQVLLSDDAMPVRFPVLRPRSLAATA